MSTFGGFRSTSGSAGTPYSALPHNQTYRAEGHGEEQGMTSTEKLEVFKHLFRGRSDAYVKTTEKGYTTVKNPLTDVIISLHLKGRQRLCRHPMSMEFLEGCGTFWACADIDDDGLTAAQQVWARLDELGVESYIEASKSEGSYHVWVFFSNVVDSKEARALLSYATDGHEINPKQTTVVGGFGNGVNLPLFGADVPKGRTVFLDPTSGFEPYQDQWEFLSRIKHISREYIQGLINSGELEIGPDIPPEDHDYSIDQRSDQPGLKHVLDSCEFIAYCRDNAATLSEPLWYAMISNLCRFEGGYDAIHELSAPYPEYSEQETDRKIKHAFKASGPISCRKIRTDGYQCLRECAVKSPAGLPFKRVVQSMEQREVIGESDRQVKFFNLTDMGNGERLAHHHGQDIRYCYPNSSWYIWDGSRWKVDKSGEIERLAKDTTRRIYIEAGHCQDDEQRQAIVKHARSSESRYRKLAMIDMARSEDEIPVLLDDLDADGWLLNCLNGTLDLRTGDLHPHRRQDMITKIVPVNYDPNATLDLWDRFLDTTTQGNEEFLGFLQRAVGYSLTGNTGEEVLFFIHGPTAAGKSTFVEAIKSVMGDYAVTADFEVFLQKYRDLGSPRNDVASLAGSRLVVSIEVQEGRRLAEGLVKMLTGGDTVRARFLYHESFEFSPEMKLWLCANHAPKVRADDSAIWRRILKLPFEHIVPEDERDPEVKATLKNPDIAGPAILAWAVQGCLRWQEYGLEIPEIVKQATAAYRKEMDILEAFIEDCCIIQPGVSVSKKDLYNEYKQWCEESGEKAEGKINFGKRLTELRYDISDETGNRNVSMWGGIGIRQNDLLNEGVKS